MSNTLFTYSQQLSNKHLSLKMSKLEKQLELMKRSYPNYADSLNVPGQHNINKWVQTLKDIFHQTHSNIPWKQAFDQCTADWQSMEKEDFSNWIKFYQGNNHLKYKMATDYFSPDDNYLGYFIPNAVSSDANKSEDIKIDFNQAKDAPVDEISAVEKKKLVEKQRKKIISRLDSIEKLLRSDEGYLLSDSEFDSLMESIYSLKKKISTLKKKGSSDLFYKDLIVREANSLVRKGFARGPALLYVAAEEHVQDYNEGDAGPIPAETAAPTQTGGSPGVPGAVPASSGPAAGGQEDTSGIVMPSDNAPPTASNASVKKNIDPQANSSRTNNTPPSVITDKGVEGFVNNMKEINFVDDFEDEDDDLVVYDTDYADDYSNILLSEAQDANAIPPPEVPPEAPIEVVDQDQQPTVNTTPNVQITFDNELENLLTKISITDVVKKLEEIAKIFKTREIPRQLSIIDMMLDKLGLISFFPSLSEATNKALESNNYILSRIEGIQAQLTGALNVKDIELTNREVIQNPEVLKVKENLQQQEEIDKQRKEMRKELADKALTERAKEEAPAIEVTEEELAPPVAAPPPVPAPVQPIPAQQATPPAQPPT